MSSNGRGDLYKTEFFCTDVVGGWFSKFGLFFSIPVVDMWGLLSKSVKPGRWKGSPITVNIRPKTKFELLLRRNFAREHCVVSVFSMQGHHIKLYEKENQVSTFL